MGYDKLIKVCAWLCTHIVGQRMMLHVPRKSISKTGEGL